MKFKILFIYSFTAKDKTQDTSSPVPHLLLLVPHILSLISHLLLLIPHLSFSLLPVFNRLYRLYSFYQQRWNYQHQKTNN